MERSTAGTTFELMLSLLFSEAYGEDRGLASPQVAVRGLPQCGNGFLFHGIEPRKTQTCRPRPEKGKIITTYWKVAGT
jgi:hypothetical protein